MSQTTPSTETAVLGGGCFWCLEAAYQLVEGVLSVTSGYAGGAVKDPGYDEVAMGHTGHAEVVKVDFNPETISYAEILEIFWALHDPTTKDRQGYDIGPEYRSIILYANEAQRRVAEDVKSEFVPLWPKPIVTEILPLTKFYEAEEHHQNFFRDNPDSRYCEVIISPKLAKLREKFATRLKKDIA